MEVKRSGSQPSGKGPVEYFTGSVRIDSRFQGSEPARVGGAFVTFEPGARTAWHTHPLGQTLIVTSGCGWAQREGAPKEEIRPGDVVWIPARRKALARRYRHHCNDPHRHRGSSRRNERRLDGKGQRRTIREVNPASRKVRARYPSAGKIGAINHETALCVSGLPSLPGSVREVGPPWGKG